MVVVGVLLVVVVLVVVRLFVVVGLVVVGMMLQVWPQDSSWIFRSPWWGWGVGHRAQSLGPYYLLGSGGGRGPGLTVSEVDRSHVPGSVWPAAVVVCGEWMTGRLEMGMFTRVWTGSCWVAASVVAAAAGRRGAWVVAGGGSWFGSGVGLGRCRFGCFLCVCGVWGCVGWCW